MTTLFYLGQFASPFYSVPLATQSSVGNAFYVTGLCGVALGVGFAIYAFIDRKRARLV
jgi:hypothetical protein